jgi:hypothetical protein
VPVITTRHALLVLLLSVACAGLAAQTPDTTWHLNVQTYSFHPKADDVNLHNTTPGLGVIRRQADWFQGAGIFRNSIGRWAGYGYLGWQHPFLPTRAGPFRFGAIAGVTHHYYFNDGGIVPLVAAVLTVPVTKTLAVDLVGIPRVGNSVYTTLNVSLSWRFR